MKNNTTFKWLIQCALLVNLLSLHVLGQNSTKIDDTVVTTGNTEIYDGLVGGIGIGTVVVIAFAILGLIICFFKDCTQVPSVMVFVGIALPLIVLAIIWGIPK